MNFRYLLLAAVLGLTACNGSDSSTKNNEADSTFSDLANAKAELEKVNAQKEAGEKHKIVLAGEIAALEARQKELKSAIETAKAELDRLQGEDGKGGEIAAQRAHLADLISQADRKVADIETAKQTLVRLGSIEDKSGGIGDAKSSYDKLVEDTETKTEELNKATELLEKLQGNDGKGGSIKEARDRLIALEGEDGKGGSIKIATDSLAGLAAKLAILNGKGEGSIFEAQEKLKELKGDGTTGSPGAIALAQNELEERRTALLDLTGDGTDKNPGEISSPLVQVKDRRFGSPPIDPNLPPVTGQSINAEVNAELAARFAEAAGMASGLLTASQAKNARWGYVADHFAAIDRDHDGYVKFGDVLDFMQGGSGTGVSTGSKSIQIVE